MTGYTIDPLSEKVRGLLRWKAADWSLCIGAGVTIGILPSWRDLSRRILERAFDRTVADCEFDDLVARTGWQFDAWIQAALNAWRDAGRDEDTFAGCVEDVLYNPLRQTAAAAHLETDLLYAFHDPTLVKRKRLLLLLRFFEERYSQASVLQLAKVLPETVRSGRPPAAVLTFSYDTVLETLISSTELIVGSLARRAFRRITAPAPPSAQGRIPIFHLHGCLIPPPPAADPSVLSRRDRRDRLIAPEASYTHMAGSTFTWPQTTFLHHAQNTNLLLIGHSLSDPNLRRWLAWATEARSRQSRRAMPHIWLRKRPVAASEAALIEQAVHHLGIRIGWLESWDDVGIALANLIALPASGTA